MHIHVHKLFDVITYTIRYMDLLWALLTPQTFWTVGLILERLSRLVSNDCKA